MPKSFKYFQNLCLFYFFIPTEAWEFIYSIRKYFYFNDEFKGL